MRFRTTPEEDARLMARPSKRRWKCTICEEILNTDPTCHENKVNGIYIRCPGTFYEIGEDVK